MSKGADDFDFSLVDEFEGYVTSKDKTNVSPKVLVRGSKNVYKKDSGTISVRPGLKRLGVSDDTPQGVKASFEWNTSLAVQRPLRVLGESPAGNDGKLQVMFDGVTEGTWYDLQTGLSLSRYIFDVYWNDTEKKDRVLFVRGDSNIYHWSGGIAVAAAQAALGTTLTLADTSKTWAQQGFTATAGEMKFKIAGNTQEYEYTGGTDTNTLTGITPDLPEILADDVVVQSVLVASDTPAAGFRCDFIKTIGNQLYVGSYTSRLIYISANDSFTNYTIPSPRVAGSPELLTLDSNPNGISSRQGKAHVSAGIGEWYIVEFKDIAVGSTLTQQTVVEKQETSAKSAAKAHEFIDTIGDDIVYLDQENQLRIFGAFRNLTTPKNPSISLAVREEFEETDFTGGAVRSVGDLIYVTAPLSGKVYIHETRESVDGNGNIVSERLWYPPWILSAARVALIDGVEHVHSTENPQIYQVWNTGQWHDDSPSGEPLPYDCIMRMAYQNAERRQGMIALDKVYFEGYISEGTELNAHILADYQGSSASVNPNVSSISSSARLFSGLNAPSLGDSSLGDNPLGDGLSDEENDQERLPKFRAICDIGKVNCFEYQIIVSSQTVDSRWEVLAFGSNAKPVENQQAAFLRKT